MSAKPPSTKRSTTSTSLDAPKPPCTIHPTAVISDKAQLVGPHPVHVGENTVLQPYCKIVASNGAVTIGKNSSVGEMAVVGGGNENTEIGDGVDIGPGAVVEAASLGEGSVVEGKVRIGSGAVLGRWCRVTPSNEVRPGEQIKDFTVVYGDGQRRLNKTLMENAEVREAKHKGQEMQVQLLKRLIPNASAKWG
jgi:dynactin-6